MQTRLLLRRRAVLALVRQRIGRLCATRRRWRRTTRTSVWCAPDRSPARQGRVSDVNSVRTRSLLAAVTLQALRCGFGRSCGCRAMRTTCNVHRRRAQTPCTDDVHRRRAADSVPAIVLHAGVAAGRRGRPAAVGAAQAEAPHARRHAGGCTCTCTVRGYTCRSRRARRPVRASVQRDSIGRRCATRRVPRRCRGAVECGTSTMFARVRGRARMHVVDPSIDRCGVHSMPSAQSMTTTWTRSTMSSSTSRRGRRVAHTAHLSYSTPDVHARCKCAL